MLFVGVASFNSVSFFSLPIRRVFPRAGFRQLLRATRVHSALRLSTDCDVTAVLSTLAGTHGRHRARARALPRPGRCERFVTTRPGCCPRSSPASRCCSFLHPGPPAPVVLGLLLGHVVVTTPYVSPALGHPDPLRSAWRRSAQSSAAHPVRASSCDVGVIKPGVGPRISRSRSLRQLTLLALPYLLPPERRFLELFALSQYSFDPTAAVSAVASASRWWWCSGIARVVGSRNSPAS